jgi:hypothetical protein
VRQKLLLLDYQVALPATKLAYNLNLVAYQQNIVGASGK